MRIKVDQKVDKMSSRKLLSDNNACDSNHKVSYNQFVDNGEDNVEGYAYQLAAVCFVKRKHHHLISRFTLQMQVIG
jgi:hypothetical protein